MTTKTLTGISWTARSIAVYFLLASIFLHVVFLGNPHVLYVLVLLGMIAAIPSRALSKHRVLSGIALCLSLIPLLLLAGVVTGLLGYVRVWSAAWWCDPLNSPSVAIFCTAAISFCSLPVALITADTLAIRGDPVEALGTWRKLVLLAVGVGGMVGLFLWLTIL
jgi:hypothetical protein